MNRDIQTFIIWKNARCFEDEILEKIKAKFTVLKEYEITWTPELFGENLSAFYGDNFIYNMFQRKTRGEGAFVLVIVEDKNPNYILTPTNRGEVLVNEKTFNLKQEIRKLTKTFSFHSSNDIAESKHDIALLLGKNLNDFLNSTELDGKREILHQDIPSARGWKSLSEFFYILNETCNYVLLRSFDAIPDTHTYRENGDVDLLVDDIKKFVAILNPTAPLHKNAFHFFNWVDFGEDNKNLLIHPKFIGDNYYDINMQKKTLETRQLNSKRVYVPTDEMYFWTLLHHGIFHKENWQKYDLIFKEIAPKIGIEYKADKDYLCQLMTDYMKKNGYKVAKHLDNGAASLMPQNIKDNSILKSEPTLYWYNNSSFRFFVFSEDAIYYEPELVTEFINSYDIFLDLHRHILDSNSYIYKYIKERMQNCEYLWSFAKRKDKFSVFSYKNINGIKSFTKHFMPEQECLETNYVTYTKQENIQYIDCKIKVDDILIKTYIHKGYNAFLDVLDKFLSELFFKYEIPENSNYLMPNAWDYLAKNVFYIEYENNIEYLFFDTEAKYNKPIHKSQAIANVIIDLDDKYFFTWEEKYAIYRYFINKYFIEDIWAWTTKQRNKEVREITLNPVNKRNCKDFVEDFLQENFEELMKQNNKPEELKYCYAHDKDDILDIKTEDISVVVQGAINNEITPRCLRSIRTFLPDAEIILSTWNNSDVENLDYDTLVLNQDPGAVKCDIIDNALNNQNRQLVSTKAGLKKANRKFILKLRTDFELHSNEFIKYFNRFPIRHKEFNIFKHRVLISSIYSRTKGNWIVPYPVLFHPSDFFMFGLSVDIKEYFEHTRLATEQELGNWCYRYPDRTPFPTCKFRYAPEQFFFLSYALQFFPNLQFHDWTEWNEENLRISESLLYNNFVFLDYKQSGIFSEKHSHALLNSNDIFGIINFIGFENVYKEHFDKNYEFFVEPLEEVSPIVISNTKEKYIKYSNKLQKHLNIFLYPIKNFLDWIMQPLSITYYFLRKIFNKYFLKKIISCFIYGKENRRKFRDE